MSRLSSRRSVHLTCGLLLMLAVPLILTWRAWRQPKAIPAPALHFRNPYEDDPLWTLCLNPQANASQVEALLTGGEKADGMFPDADTPLMAAVSFGNLAVAKTLIKHGANTNARGRAGNTPLMYVSDWQAEPMVTLLVAHGAEVNAQTQAGNTALIEVTKRGDHLAVKSLIAHGAKVNGRNHQGQTAMKIAKQGIWEDVREVLQAAGAKE